MYILSEFITTSPGEPFRLFPFGTIHKNGREINITPEMAATFKLPHFKPPIKLGSHDDMTPAGGHIIGLEVRPDGLYAVPEFNPNGTAAITEGRFRYHSPEVIWEGGLEDPATGELIEGPLIVGDALLHTPHLGEATALYTYEQLYTEATTMTDENITVPASFLERLFGTKEKEPAPEPQPQEAAPAVPEEFAAQITTLQAQLEQYQAQIATMEADKAQRDRVAHFAAAFDGTAAQGNSDLFTILADLDEETAEKLTPHIQALAAQAQQSGLTDEIGAADKGDTDPVQNTNAAIEKYMADHEVNYNDAVKALVNEQPSLFEGVY